MRKEINSWESLTPSEQTELAFLLTNDPTTLFNSLPQETKDSLINIYYLSVSNKVAGNLWQYFKSLKWAGPNQIGVYAENIPKLYHQLLESSNFIEDDWLTCLVKKCHWSLRQTIVDGKKISEYGMQVYYPKDPNQPELLVIDIDIIVFSSWASWPKHALDILAPDPLLNNPLQVRQALTARGIFPK